MNKNVILQGILGSTAYGLANENSDIDQLGVFVEQTHEFHGLTLPKETYVIANPDLTLHELGKFCRLAINGNPTVIELLWLDSYEITTKYGQELIDIREYFLSAPRIRAAYLGYATQQLHKLQLRDDSVEAKQKISKHARHLLRLCRQGYQLYLTGKLEIKLTKPNEIWDFGDAVANGDIELVKTVLSYYEGLFNNGITTLAQEPKTFLIDNWLKSVRMRTYAQSFEYMEG